MAILSLVMEKRPKFSTPVVEAIWEELKRLDWSVQDLGAASGVPYPTIYRIFDGASPNIKTVNKLLKPMKLKLVVAR